MARLELYGITGCIMYDAATVLQSGVFVCAEQHVGIGLRESRSHHIDYELCGTTCMYVHINYTSGYYDYSYERTEQDDLAVC